MVFPFCMQFYKDQPQTTQDLDSNTKALSKILVVG